MAALSLAEVQAWAQLALDQLIQDAARQEALAKEQSLPSATATMTQQGTTARPSSSIGYPGKADSKRRPHSGKLGRDGGAGHRGHMAPGCKLGAKQSHSGPATHHRCASDVTTSSHVL